MKKNEKENIEEALSKLSSTFLSPLPNLLSTFQTDPTLLRILLLLPRFIRLSDYSHLRQKKSFLELLRVLRQIYIQHTDLYVLEETASNLWFISTQSHQYAEEAKRMVGELGIEIIGNLEKAVEEEDENKEGSRDGNEIEEIKEKEAQILAALKRLVCLSRLMYIKDLEWNSHPTLEQQLSHFLVSHQQLYEQFALIHLLHLSFTDLMWHYTQIDRENPQRDTLIQMVQHSKKLISHLDFILHQSSAFPVKDEAFKLLSDLFVLFTGKLVGTNLSALSIPHDRLLPLQKIYHHYFHSLLEPEEEELNLRIEDTVGLKDKIEKKNDSDEEIVIPVKEQVLQEVRLWAMIHACKVVQYDQDLISMATSTKELSSNNSTLRHPLLAAAVISSYTKYTSEIDAVIKHCMNQLKATSPNTLLFAQYQALRYLYEEKEMELNKIRELAERFVFMFGFSAEKRSFVGIVKAGISYAVMDVPDHLSFLDCLIPFVNRSSPADITILAHFYASGVKIALQLAEKEEEEVDEEIWKPMQNFKEVLERKTSGGKGGKRGAASTRSSSPSPARSGRASPLLSTPNQRNRGRPSKPLTTTELEEDFNSAFEMRNETKSSSSRSSTNENKQGEIRKTGTKRSRSGGREERDGDVDLGLDLSLTPISRASIHSRTSDSGGGRHSSTFSSNSSLTPSTRQSLASVLESADEMDSASNRKKPRRGRGEKDREEEEEEEEKKEEIKTTATTRVLSGQQRTYGKKKGAAAKTTEEEEEEEEEEEGESLGQLEIEEAPTRPKRRLALPIRSLADVDEDFIGGSLSSTESQGNDEDFELSD